jgi:hypothetical protein
VVSVAPYPGRPWDARVTVVRVEGAPGVVRLLEEVVGVIERGTGAARQRQRMAGPEDLALPGSVVVRDISLPNTDVPLLLRQIEQGSASPAVREMYSSIIRGADTIRVTTYRVGTRISVEQFLQFYRAIAQRLSWGEVTQDTSDRLRPMVVFSLGDGNGIVMVRGESADVVVPRGRGITEVVPTTSVTLLVVQGKLDLKALRGNR